MKRPGIPGRALLPAGAVAAVMLAAGIGARHPSFDLLTSPRSPRTARLPFRLDESAREAGLLFSHRKARLHPSLKNVEPWITSVGVSVAVTDFDGDGRPDVYVTNTARGSRNALFRNRGDGKFEEVGAKAGIADVNRGANSLRALFFDMDGDGLDDLFLSRALAPKVFRNRGDGTFEDVTERSGVDHRGISYASAALDVEGDGDLDLVVADYFPPVDFYAPKDYAFMQNSLVAADNGGPILVYVNDGAGRFSLAPDGFGIRSRGWTNAVGVYDFQGDGRPDLYFATDYNSDQAYINEGGGRLRDVSAAVTHKYSRSGMNAEIADADGNGRPEVYVTHIFEPPYKIGPNTVWEWVGGEKHFEPKTDLQDQVGECGWAWGAKFLDLDNDSRLDLVVTNGFISGRPDKDYWYPLSTMSSANAQVIADARNWPPMEDSSLAGFQRKCVFHNRGGRFERVTDLTGMRDDVSDGRALAVIDALGDGSLGVIVGVQGGPLRYYRNKAPRGNAWIGFDLRGAGKRRHAWGARVILRLKDRELVREKQPANGYMSQSDPRLHFGLGADREIREVEVRWPGGKRQVYRGLLPGRYHRLEET